MNATLHFYSQFIFAAAAKSLQSCPTLCYPIDGSPLGSSDPGILQARTLECVAISFSNACMHAKSLQSCLTPCDPTDSSPPGSSVHRILQAVSVQFSSVAQSCLTLCDHMNRSTPDHLVHHQFPEFTQTHVHQVSDAIQPSHPRSSPSPLAPNPSPHQSLFQWVNSSHEVAKVPEFQLGHHSLQRNPRADLQNGLVGSPCSPRDSQESSPTPHFKSINSSALSLLHSPTLTSIHDHRKSHSLD